MPKSSKISSYKNWEIDAAELLNSRATRFSSIPSTELIGRGLEKLFRQSIKSRRQLEILIPHVVRQVMIDIARVRRREEDRYSGVDPDDLMALSPDHLAQVHERLAYLVGAKSPLDEAERQVLALALEHPEEFMRPSGQVRQSALARRLGVDQKTIFNRWRSLRRKLAQANDSMLPSMGGP